jgi:VWFA-related protein
MFSYSRVLYLPLAALVFSLVQQNQASADDDPVFRSDVSLVRVDVSVLDRGNRAITGLRADDFVLRESGRAQQIRNFASEEMPIDLLLLLDVSASMRPHVQRIADATHQALRILRDEDRVGIMVFDRATRVRLSLRNGHTRDVEREMDSLLRQETFRGGTDITRAMLDAADYIGSNGRLEARRAIVILTDDETEFNRDDERVERALARADAVMSALIAPNAMQYRSGRHGQGGGGWPGSGGPMGGGGGPLGGIILGRPRGPYGGPGGPGQQAGGHRTQSAGTAEIARQSGGDSMPVDGAYALDDTLARIRQRYALHFNLPGGARAGEQRSISVALSDAALRRYPYAEVRYRKEYYVPAGVTPSQSPSQPAVISQAPVTDPDRPPVQRRRGVSQSDGDSPVPILRTPDPQPAATSSSTSTANPSPAPAASAGNSRTPPQQPSQPSGGRWRKVSPAEQQQQQQ